MPFLAHVDGGLDDGRHLHVEDLGIGDAEAAAAVAEHRVGLVELLAAVLDLLGADAGDLGELVDAGVILGA